MQARHETISSLLAYGLSVKFSPCSSSWTNGCIVSMGSHLHGNTCVPFSYKFALSAFTQTCPRVMQHLPISHSRSFTSHPDLWSTFVYNSLSQQQQ